MGICDWFKRIICQKRKKGKDLKKLEQIQSNSKNSGFHASSRKVMGRSMGTKEFAAIRIQTTFRAYRARKRLRGLKGRTRFQALVEADALMKQASTALDRIHFWSKIQGEIRTRRLYMVTEGRIKQKKIENQLKIDSKLHELEVEWCNGPETMEEILSKIQQKEEATNKRERAMAYAFSHQWRASSNRYFGQAYYDLSKESWGWSWKERWIAVCPWEARVVARPVISTKARKKDKPGKTTKHAATPKILLAVKPHHGDGKGTTKATNCTS